VFLHGGEQYHSAGLCIRAISLTTVTPSRRSICGAGKSGVRAAREHRDMAGDRRPAERVRGRHGCLIGHSMGFARRASSGAARQPSALDVALLARAFPEARLASPTSWRRTMHRQADAHSHDQRLVPLPYAHYPEQPGPGILCDRREPAADAGRQKRVLHADFAACDCPKNRNRARRPVKCPRCSCCRRRVAMTPAPRRDVTSPGRYLIRPCDAGLRRPQPHGEKPDEVLDALANSRA